jgi:hypothetical protein
MRLVIELKRGEVPEVILNQFIQTDAAARYVRHEYGGLG